MATLPADGPYRRLLTAACVLSTNHEQDGRVSPIKAGAMQRRFRQRAAVCSGDFAVLYRVPQTRRLEKLADFLAPRGRSQPVREILLQIPCRCSKKARVAQSKVAA
jgi:hypothetical protein